MNRRVMNAAGKFWLGNFALLGLALVCWVEH
jgi:hypothetical protein